MTPELLQGARHTDSRGWLDFFNDLDLGPVVRLYRIGPSDPLTIRAWQGHQHERKWFYCVQGSFIVNLVPLTKINDGISPITPEIYTVRASSQHVLKIPAGYLNGFRALEPGSELLIFSDKTLQESIADDFRLGLEVLPFREHK